MKDDAPIADVQLAAVNLKKYFGQQLQQLIASITRASMASGETHRGPHEND